MCFLGYGKASLVAVSIEGLEGLLQRQGYFSQSRACPLCVTGLNSLRPRCESPWYWACSSVWWAASLSWLVKAKQGQRYRWIMCGQRQHYSPVPKCLTSPAPSLHRVEKICVLGNPCRIHFGELRGGPQALGNSNKAGADSASPSHLPCPQKPEGIKEA